MSRAIAVSGRPLRIVQAASVAVVALLLAVLAPSLLDGAGAVGTAPSATALSLDATAAYVGESVTLSATVTGGAGVPTGKVTFKRGTSSLGAVNLVEGVATLTTTKVPVGAWPVTATYSGSKVYAVSTSASRPLTVTKAPTAITVAVEPDAPNHVAGEPVTLRADVVVPDRPSVVPQGKVTFRNGTKSLGSVALVDGSASLVTTKLPIGSLPITAAYSGSSALDVSTSDVRPMVVDKAPTTMSLTTTDLVPSAGQSVTLRAYVSAVAPSVEKVTGKVTFTAGGKSIGSASVSAEGVAQLVTTKLAAGPIAVSASYAGSARLLGSSVGAAVQPTNLALTGPASSSAGSSAAFTATVTPVGTFTSPPSGTVVLREADTELATASLVGGQATFSLDDLAVGSHQLTASYGGAASFGSSQSAPLVHEVGPGSTAVSLDGSSTSSVAGEDVTFIATVAPNVGGSGTPTGIVGFRAVPDDGGTSVTLGDAVVVDGVATLTAALSRAAADESIDASGGARAFTVHADYAGDTTFDSASATTTHAVASAESSVQVTATPDSVAVGADLVLSASITVIEPGRATPTGTVTFTRAGDVLGTAAVGPDGTAALTTAAVPIGDHLVVAEYAGDGNVAPSANAAVASVVAYATETTVVADAPSTGLGDGVTFTATVTSSSGAPTGSVTFRAGTTVVGTVALGGATATLTTDALVAGEQMILATYSGDPTFAASTSDYLSHTVVGLETSVLGGANGAQPLGVANGMGASVIPVASAGPATGTMTFLENDVVIGTGTVGAVSADFALADAPPMGAGTHQVVARYSGDATYAPSESPAFDVVVTPGTTTLTVTSSDDVSNVGEAVTFSIELRPVVPTNPTPTGDLQLSIDEGGSGGTATLTVVDGKASYTTSELAARAHLIVVQYPGDANYEANQGLAFQQVLLPTAVTVTSNANPASEGVPFVVTASVTSTQASAPPTGTVTFREGATVLGTVGLMGIDDPMMGIGSWTITPTGIGNHPITVSYSGDISFSPSTSDVFNQAVGIGVSHTTLASGANPAAFGGAVTLTAAVSAPLGAPAGSIAFYDGATLLGSASISDGIAMLTTTDIAAGARVLTAVYGGDATHAGSTSPALAQSVQRVTTPLTVTSSANPAQIDQLPTFGVTLGGAFGRTPTGTVSYRASSDATAWGYAVDADLGTYPVVDGVAAGPLFTLGAGGRWNLGRWTITATYSGDATFAPTTTSITQVVHDRPSLWGFGSNGSGQLGDGTTINRTTPTMVPPLGGSDWRSVASGVHSYAIDTDGRLWGWGAAPLGDGTSTSSTIPVPIGSDTWETVDVSVVGTVLAVRSDGTLWTWGGNAPFLTPTGASSRVPTQIGTDADWATVSVGSQMAHALKTDGSLWGWGTWFVGTITESTYSYAQFFTPQPPRRIGTDTWRALAGGYTGGEPYEDYAIRSDGTLWSIDARAAYHQVGSARWSSVTVTDGLTGPIGATSTVVGIQEDGSLWAWGNNRYGQLGDGTMVDRSAPVAIGGSATWSAVAGGAGSSYAIRSDGTLWAWGANDVGQLGLGSIGGTHSAPTQVGNLDGYIAVDARGSINSATEVATGSVLALAVR